MNFMEIRAAVETYFDEQWNHRQPDVPVGYQNVTFNPPNDSPWVKMGFQPSGAYRISTNNCYEYRGMVVVEIYVPKQTGMATAEELTDTVVELFKNSSLSVGFDDITVSFAGEVNDRITLTNVFIEYRAT